MKRLAGLDERLLHMDGTGDKPENMPLRRDALKTIGNVKAATADDARRTRRIVMKLRDKQQPDLLLENEDMAFVEKMFERNEMGLSAWLQGQILDLLDSVEKVDAAPK